MYTEDYPDLINYTFYYDENYIYADYMYPGYSFERPVYLYIWEILVIVTFLVNIVVISVLLHNKMRNPTNLILAAIAVSDSLTGLVTLPTYIMAYRNFEPARSGQSDGYNTSGLPIYPGPQYPMVTQINQPLQGFLLNSSTSYSNENMRTSHYFQGHMMGNALTNFSNTGFPATRRPQEGYNLSKTLCTGFMISKFFLSKWFHTISIYLTLFVCVQRFISVVCPFKSQRIFTNMKTFCYCGIVFVVSIVLHVYHLKDEKAQNGLCQWDLPETGCKGGCAYLWIIFFIRHFIPCTTMMVLTILFIKELKKSERNFRKTDSSTMTLMRRVQENRRVTVIVVAIVIVFLIPEVPYGLFLFSNAVERTILNGTGTDLETNRAIHMAYELLLVLSFHANFYIYMLYNRRFRKTLRHILIYPVLHLFGDRRRFSRSTSSAISQMFHKTDILSKCGTSGRENELKTLNPIELSPTKICTGETETSRRDIENEHASTRAEERSKESNTNSQYV